MWQHVNSSQSVYSIHAFPSQEAILLVDVKPPNCFTCGQPFVRNCTEFREKEKKNTRVFSCGDCAVNSTRNLMDPAYRIVPDGQVRRVTEDGREVQEVEVAAPTTVEGGLQYYVVYSQDGAPMSYALAPQVGATGGTVYCPPGATQNVGQNSAVIAYGVADPSAVASVTYGSPGYNTPGSPESETLTFNYGQGQKCIVRKSVEPPAEFILPKGGGHGQTTRYYILEPESASDDGIMNLEQYCAFPVIDRPKVQKLYEFEIIARRPPLEGDPVLHAIRLRLYAPTSMGAKQRFWFLMRHWRRFRTMDLEIESVTQKNGSLVVRWATSEAKPPSNKSTTDISRPASVVHL